MAELYWARVNQVPPEKKNLEILIILQLSLLILNVFVLIDEILINFLMLISLFVMVLPLMTIVTFYIIS